MASSTNVRWNIRANGIESALDVGVTDVLFTVDAGLIGKYLRTPTGATRSVTNLGYTSFDFQVDKRFRLNQLQSFADEDATPSVYSGSFFKTANTGATTITNFDDGDESQIIKILIQDANTTIDFTGTNLKGNGGADWSPGNGDWLEAVFDGTNWYCSVHDCTA